MKTILLILGFLGQLGLLSAAAASASIECTRPVDGLVERFAAAGLQPCDDIKPNTVCEYTEGHDSFWAYAFDKSAVSAAQPGDSVAGYYLEGVVFTSWLVTHEQEITCKAL